MPNNRPYRTDSEANVRFVDADGFIKRKLFSTAKGENLGDYIKGKSAKTCPGTNFFGGNTVAAYKNNLMPLLNNYGNTGTNTGYPDEITEINDIVRELVNAGIISDGDLWAQKCAEDVDVYWICHKMANKLKGVY